ncbi:nicotinate phosphoribosyltransferase [Candidatus Microgenomates bacterium]|nr:MAG: nicotinate phosphoribosyltransferase [Candidatus Microgenomates bacterium]
MQYWDRRQIDDIRRGFYSAVYFNRTKQILLKEGTTTSVVMQLFQKQAQSVLCGIDELKVLFELGSGYFANRKWIDKHDTVRIESLADGDVVNPFETVAHITGPYVYSAHLESLYLGILARRTLVATNTRRVVRAAQKKPVLFFADRFDDFQNQAGDGYAATVGGAAAVCTPAQATHINGIPIGTIPHALIAVNHGDTVKTAKLFAKHFPKERLTVLVDFDNDCVHTSLAVANQLGKKLWAIRIDTSEKIIDRSLLPSKKTEDYGVNPKLVRLVRKALDDHGHTHVQIAVSGGFTAEKISRFEKEQTPVDMYGVGSALLKGNNDFTADIVKVDNRLISKQGRKYKPNPRLQKLL